MAEGVLLALLAESKPLLVVSMGEGIGEVFVASVVACQVPGHEFTYPRNKTTSGMAAANVVSTWQSLGQSPSLS